MSGHQSITGITMKLLPIIVCLVAFGLLLSTEISAQRKALDGQLQGLSVMGRPLRFLRKEPSRRVSTRTMTRVSRKKFKLAPLQQLIISCKKSLYQANI
ncbi:unnamed protein product [Oppiella nova]|uniref:Uncharacterized protein n=1 Tax=Oppiella nova TaxID=334625 RepID=A0A7R9MFM2_9ACAR|nr:unnamed protein product [Oppiella nova]CAG2176356.1 unnamed protein product [Oppiella nova]